MIDFITKIVPKIYVYNKMKYEALDEPIGEKGIKDDYKKYADALEEFRRNAI